MRLLVASLAATLVLASGCTTHDVSVPDNLLQVDDLPAKPGKTTDAERIPSIGSYCQLEFGGILGPSFKVTGVEYSGVDGSTITSLVTTNPAVSDDRIARIRSEVERCASRTQDTSHQVELLDLGDNNAAFTAEAYDDAEAPAGEIAITRVKKSYVIVAVEAPTDTATATSQSDLAALLDAAVTRVQAATSD